MRPSINGGLEAKIEEHRDRVGCDSNSEFVRFATRKLIAELEAEK